MRLAPLVQVNPRPNILGRVENLSCIYAVDCHPAMGMYIPSDATPHKLCHVQPDTPPMRPVPGQGSCVL